MKVLCRLLMHANGGIALFFFILCVINGDASFGVIGAVNLAIALGFHKQLVRS